MSWDRKAERKEKFEKKHKAKTKQHQKERTSSSFYRSQNVSWFYHLSPVK